MGLGTKDCELIVEHTMVKRDVENWKSPWPSWKYAKTDTAVS